MTDLAWHHAQYTLPPDWDVTAYAIESREGRIECSSRHGLQAVWGWEPCKREPDTQAMMNAFILRRAGRKNGDPFLQTSEIQGWTVGQSEGQPIQAMRYLEDQHILLYWVFEPVTTPHWEGVLRSFRPNAGPWRRYCIHGLDVRLPDTYAVEDMHVLPANVMITFESSTKARVVFRRWGLPEYVLAGRGLPEFYQWLLKGTGARVTRMEAATPLGHPGAEGTFEQRGQHQMDKTLGRVWSNSKAWLWHHEREQRIYSVEQIAPKKVSLLALGDMVGGEGA